MIQIQVADPLREKFDQGVKTLYELLITGRWVLMAATSFGKDSSVSLSMVLQAARLATERGIEYPAVIVSHADTGIENSEILNLNRGEIQKVHTYCKVHGINYVFSHARPHLMEGYLVRIIGGNKMPTYPDGNAECSKMLKVDPQLRQAKQIMQFVQKRYPHARLCSVTGVRLDESATRRANMLARGDSDKAPVLYNDRWSIAPIASWSEEDVFTFLHKAKGYSLYSTFEGTLDIYADASGSGCVGIGMAISDDQKAARESKGCGARFGCSVCVRVGEDKSMQAMLELPKYEYMRELNAFRNYLMDIRWDLSRRCHLARSISAEGYLDIGPDNFHPDTLEEMFRMVLTIQAKENEQAQALGIAPRIQLVDEQFIAAIDFNWSRYGRHKPFHAWVVAKEVLDQGKWLLPSTVKLTKHERPKAFDKKAGAIQVHTYGLFDTDSFCNPVAQALDEGRCENLEVVPLGAGHARSNPLNLDCTFTFDKEGLAMFIDFELDRYIKEYHNEHTNPTAAAKVYASYGCLSASTRGFLATDRILKVADVLWINGLSKLSNAELVAMARPELLKRPAVQARPAQSSPGEQPGNQPGGQKTQVTQPTGSVKHSEPTVCVVSEQLELCF